jgi:hypothetical protein
VVRKRWESLFRYFEHNDVRRRYETGHHIGGQLGNITISSNEPAFLKKLREPRECWESEAVMQNKQATVHSSGVRPAGRFVMPPGARIDAGWWIVKLSHLNAGSGQCYQRVKAGRRIAD